MQKIIRKFSGPSGESLGDDEMICLLGTKDKFPADKLLQALKSASELSIKSGSAATLVLPPSASTLSSNIKIDGNIELIGQLKESRTVLNFTKDAKVTFSPNASLKLDKLQVGLQDSKSSVFEISSGSKMEILESSFEVEGSRVSFRVEGTLVMRGNEFSNTVIEVYEAGSLDIDGCKFSGYETNQEISAISFFGGATKNTIAACEFKDCANSIVIDGQKIRPGIDIIGTDFQNSKEAVIAVAAEVQLHKAKSTSGFKFSEGSVVNCKDVEVTQQSGQVSFFATDSNVSFDNTNVNDAEVALVAKKCSLKIRSMKIFDVKKEAMNLTDCEGTIYTVHVNNQNTKKDGLHIIFQDASTTKLNFADCKSQNCTIGVKVEDRLKQSKFEDKSEQSEMGFVLDKRSKRRSKAVLENCSFIKCQIGLSVHNAKVSAKGCSFIMSGRHSFFLEGGNALLLKVRWPNYVEPFIDNTTALANNAEVLADATIEKLFCGSSDFEPTMYLPTLTERLRQARNVFRSKEHNCELKARVIMKSISHMLVLLRKLMTPLIDRELMEDPNLGMFAATFKLEEPERPSHSKNIIPMDLLLESWKSLSKTKLFDDALFALNEAFERKQVEEEVYDEIVSPLEEMQRTCFVKSKFSRRREYLLQTAKENPLSAWFFLDKEDRNTADGIRLREEVLKFLASEVGDNGVMTSTFHVSWVAQWAVRLLGDNFLKTEIPESINLRRAWADKLLDNGQGSLLLEQYGTKDYKEPADQLFKFEAYRQIESQGVNLNAEQHKRVSELLDGQGYPQAVRVAAKLFKGEGTLPGFLRREAEKAQSAESLLEILSHANEDPQQTRYKKKQVVLAVMSHFLNRDENEMPKIPEQKNHIYKACPTCMVQKLQPWNALSLKECNANHRVCKQCMKTSMSTGAIDLWGKCPGVIDGGKPCPAVATRREMEMAGMESEKIYNILENRVTRHLHSLPGWKSCDNVGCIGGRSHVKKDYYTCWLCTKVVTLDGGKGDPTVARKLLHGFQASQIPRGEGSVRECYHCGVIYEKGNACSTITCSACSKDFNMTFGPDQINHKFDENGIGPQRYVPKLKGKLWELGVFKTKKGQDLELGQELTENEALEVVRRCKVKLETLDG